eukprot:CAMPEP_0116849574 /NCGR_PEP_ID=MMETSP0418-20121206/15652_1 /TAXON_ID=1158023 /ORGANISM="Astrosyne radiata, Strain 13vi08-1A" /LENGTH=127 /DNA_ID=CAMNT_0004481319 /DNA_START=73 /DNA_END=456 /DNA_ORIENTATION=+
MSNNLLNGEIPPSIGSLSLLASLSLRGNQLEGSIPSLFPHNQVGAANGLNFQATLFGHGKVELRWGEGNLPSSQSIAAGIEDDEAHIAVPASESPFGDGGVTAPGTWPTNQCRAFVPDGNGGVNELE